jgi:hypothetical protein
VRYASGEIRIVASVTSAVAAVGATVAPPLRRTAAAVALQWPGTPVPARSYSGSISSSSSISRALPLIPRPTSTAVSSGTAAAAATTTAAAAAGGSAAAVTAVRIQRQGARWIELPAVPTLDNLHSIADALWEVTSKIGDDKAPTHTDEVCDRSLCTHAL